MHKVSDLIADFLKYHKIETVFGIIGSANSHIFDSINSLGYTKVVNVHHEQVAVMAMGAYFRASGKISATIVTAGAGSANAITGIISNWADSIPGIIISGNEPSIYIESHKKLRMYGTQGFDIADMVKKVTKYSKCLLKKEDIYSELNKCIQISLEDRKGPVLLDIPFDIQASSVKPKNWKKIPISANNYKTDIKFIINEINSAERPLVLGGHGIRLSNSVDLFKKFINNSNLPTTLSWSAIDILDSENKNFYGRFGLYGQRAANLIVQNCDLLIVIGSRLALPQTGYNYENFVRDGKIILVDVEEPQIAKAKIFKHIKKNCRDVLAELVNSSKLINPINIKWKDYCNKILRKYSWVEKIHKQNDQYINSYTFMDLLSDFLNDDHIIVTDMGTALLSGHQSIKLKENQTMFTSQGLGEMGYGISGAIGAAFACPNKEVLCLNCDGGIMMNLQELHTIIENNLRVKIIIFNNDGYLMIKHTQKMLFNGRHTSINKKTGIGLPNFEKVFKAFGYNYFKLDNKSEVSKVLKKFFKNKHQSLLEVYMDPFQGFLPKVMGVLKSDNSILPMPIEDMSPLLKKEEFNEAMLVKILKESKNARK